MKHIILSLILAAFSLSAFAQFPLGADKEEIKAYFGDNISYATVQDYKTPTGVEAVCFTKVRVVGDYTFYFDVNGLCSSYVVTYDRNDLAQVTALFDKNYCRTQMDKWTAEDNSFDIKLVLPKTGQNFISLVYQPKPIVAYSTNTLAAN